MGLFNKKEVAIFSPVKGKLIRLEEVDDDIFSKKIMGEGFAVIPEKGVFTSPIDGEVTLLHECNHAFGVTNKQGVEVLTHIGLDTVKLEGKGFKPLVHVGSLVKVGDPIIEVEVELITDDVKSLVTPVILGNINDYSIVEMNYEAKKSMPVVKIRKGKS